MCDAGSGLHLDCGPARTRTHIYTVPDIEACEVGGVWLNRLGRCSARETHPIWVGSTLWTALNRHKGLRGSLRAVPEVRHVNKSVFDCQNFDSPPMSMQYTGAACRQNTSTGTVRLLRLEHSILFQKTRELFQKT